MTMRNVAKDTDRPMTLEQLARYARNHGLPTASVGSTGGGCLSVVIELSDGGEILLNDIDGPSEDRAEELTAILACGYDAELMVWPDPIFQSADPDDNEIDLRADAANAVRATIEAMHLRGLTAAAERRR